MALWAQETYVNATEDHIIGESGVQKTFTDSLGKLFRSCQQEFGRCTTRVYVDGADGQPKAVGWIFVKRVPYQDSPDTYLQETWVTVHDAPPTRTIEYHYHQAS